MPYACHGCGRVFEPQGSTVGLYCTACIGENNVIKVSNEVTVYEVDGKEPGGLPMPTLTIASHWNRDSLVVLHVNGQRLTVAARDLQAAVSNATNVARH